MNKEEKMVLSISILISNRIDTIRKCMESIKPLLTEIPCELIAVDTVGETTDGSIDVVREYTDKIYRFEWCNDFAKARNFGLEKCIGEWFMFMDDDEWFEDVTELVEFFKTGEYKKYNSASYKIHSYISKEGNVSSSRLFRMVKREKNTCFVGKIHEYLQPLLTPAKEFSAFIHHYGYCFETEEDKKTHSERNIGLLLPEFKKDPWNMHNRVQLVQEYFFMEEYQKDALKLCEETLAGDKKYYKTNEFQWIMATYVRLAGKVADFSEVVRRAEFVRKNFPLNAIADVTICFIESYARYKLEQYTEGVAVFEHALNRRQYLLENAGAKQLMMIMDFESYLESVVYAELLKTGIRCYLKIRNNERVKELTEERFSVLNKPVLTVSVLISNRKNTVRKCLESIRPLLDSIPSELIVVDTVGEKNSDGSLAIAKEYTEHIVPFEWCDDFAAARNAGLQEAKGEWFLYLDDDEWFESTEELQNFFCSGEYLSYSSANYQVRNYVDIHGEQYQTEAVGRMVQRGKNTRFVGCVRETLEERYLPNKELSDYVHHYKYARESAEEKVARMQYVYNLLVKELEKNPKNFRNRVQLAAVLLGKNPAEARLVCLDTLKICKEKKEMEQYQWQIAVLYSLQENQQADAAEAEAVYQWLKAEDLMTPEAEQIVCYRMTRIWIIKGQYVKAYRYAKKYFELGNEIENRKEVLSAEFAKYQIAEYYEEMLKLGAFCAWQAKAYADAWLMYECMSWETVDVTEEDTLWKLFAMAEEYADDMVLYRIVKRLMTNERVKPVLGRMMQNTQIKNRVQNALNAQRVCDDTKIKLTISLLVSNRKDTIRKCMESLRPILEQVSSELIVVDTVGDENSDGSLAIAKEYTDKIVHFGWCNDFAAARNAGLHQAKGDWFMFLDDDEWFEDTDELIAFFNSEEEKRYNSATYGIRNYKDAEGKAYSTAVLGRVVRRTEALRFVGTIHETFSEFRLPCKEFVTYVHHYGYVYTNEEEKKQHIQRNVELLKKEIAKEPKNLRYRAQMAMELATFDNVAALQFCKESLLICEEKKDASEFQWLLSLIFRLYEALGVSAKEAENSYCELKQKYKFSETAENAICAQMTRILLLQGEYASAHPYAERYLAIADWLKKNRELAQLQMTADFARYLEDAYYLEQLHYAAFCAWKAKKYDAAWEHYEALPWENPEYQNEEGLQHMYALAQETGNKERLIKMLTCLKKNQEEDKEILVTVSLLVSNRKDTIRKCLDSLKPLLEMVPSELIAVDTVGEENSDGSLGIVKEYTDKIIHFDWCNDFAAARNAGLMRASGKWFLYLDDDEWFEDIMPIVMFFLEGDYKNYDRGWYIVRNYSDFSGKNYGDNVVDRMCRITEKTRFVGRVHECLTPESEKVMKFDCYVHHYGYAYTDEEARIRHTERNMRLLEGELKENPNDLRMNGQMVQECCVVGRYAEAEKICEHFLEKNIKNAHDIYVQYFAAMLVRINVKCGKGTLALEKYREIKDKFQLMELPDLVCLSECLTLTNELDDSEKLKLVQEWLLQRDNIRKNAERMQVQEIFDFRIYLSAEYEKGILLYGIQIAAVTESYDMLSALLERVDWKNKEEKPFEEMLLLVDIYGKSGRRDLFFPYAEQIMENPKMNNPFMVSLNGLLQEHPELQNEVNAWLKNLDGNANKKQLSTEMGRLVEMLKANIQVLLKEGKTAEAKMLLEELKKYM